MRIKSSEAILPSILWTIHKAPEMWTFFKLPWYESFSFVSFNIMLTFSNTSTYHELVWAHEECFFFCEVCMQENFSELRFDEHQCMSEKHQINIISHFMNHGAQYFHALHFNLEEKKWKFVTKNVSIRYHSQFDQSIY